VSIKRSRASSRRWQLRDLPRVYVLLVWAAFGASIVYYFLDSTPVQHKAAATSDRAGKSAKDIDDALYTGSIVVVPDRGERCRELGLDNRTGQRWEKGYINCYDVVARAVARDNLYKLSGERLRVIGKAFHSGTD
jgi:hypothetical protein